METAQQQSEQQQLVRLGRGQGPLHLHASVELAVQAFNRIGGPQRLPLAGWKLVEREQFVARLAQLAVTFGARFSQVVKGLIGLAGQGHQLRMDNPLIVGAQVVMRMSRDMAFQIPQLQQCLSFLRSIRPGENAIQFLAVCVAVLIFLNCRTFF